jgi:hypothetical protein
MIVTVYITEKLFAVEVMSGRNLIHREVCDRARFAVLMEEMTMPETYCIKHSVINISEYMKIGKLKNMIPSKVERINTLDLKTYFKTTPKRKGGSVIVSLDILLFGVLIGIIIMSSTVVKDMLITREERIENAQSILEFNEENGENQIDGTGLYTELRAVYNPFRIELFKVEMDGTVEIMFLHGEPSLNLMQMDSLNNAKLSKGASVTVDERVLYIYQLGGELYAD